MTDFNDPESIAATPEGRAFIEAAGALCGLLAENHSTYGMLFLPTTALAAAGSAARLIAESFDDVVKGGAPEARGGASILSAFARDVEAIMEKTAMGLIDEVDNRRLADQDAAEAEADKLGLEIKRMEGGEQ